jgi:uncharacterized membrane protein YesL
VTEANGASRTTAVMAKVSVVGDLLMLQLLFLICTIGIVTLVPAAFALQRVLPEAIGQEHPALARRFWRQLKWAFRRFWLAGLGLYVGSIALATGIFFWVSTAGPIRFVALVILIPLTGLLVGLYLSVLAVLPEVGDDITSRTLLRAANMFLLRRSLAVAGGVIGLATWLLLLVKLPTLFVVGSGLVPALLAYVIGRTTTVKDKKTEQNS